MNVEWERGAIMTLEEILAGESKNVEFKENLPEKSIKYMKSVVAFANGTQRYKNCANFMKCADATINETIVPKP